MKFLHYVFLITGMYNAQSHLINIQNKKICANCKFFIEEEKQCRIFGEVDIITGVHDYYPAIKARSDEDKCGEYAIFFKKNNFKFITLPAKYILNNWLLLLTISGQITIILACVVNFAILLNRP